MKVTGTYEPRGGAVRLMECRDREILWEGPAGTGKSRALLTKCHAVAEKYPNARILIIRKTRVSMSESVLVTLERDVLMVGHPAREGPTRAHRTVYRYTNGSTIVVGGLDNADRLMSTDFDIIAVFEATEATQDEWEKLSTRLRNGVVPYQQIIADCNPSGSMHWLNQRANAGLMTRLLSRHEDNPFLFDGGDWTDRGRDYIATLDRLSGHRRDRLRFGKWATAEGLVYDGFDASIHVVQRFPIPDEWPRYRSIDFGFTNPFVCQWWAIDPDGRMILYRELYRTRTLVEDHAREIARLSEGERITATVSDHDAEDRATLDRRGILTMPAMKSVRVGIDAMTARLRVQPDGKPRMMLFADALVEADQSLRDAKLPACMAEEMECYSWPKGVDGKALKEEPVKLHDHGADTARYMVCYLDNPSNVWVADPDATPPLAKRANAVTLDPYSEDAPGWSDVI